MTSSYEETVLLPVSAYLDVCAGDADADDGDGEAMAADLDLFPAARADAVRAIAASIERGGGGGGGGDPEAFRHWAQFLRGGDDCGDAGDDGASCGGSAVVSISPEAQVRDELLASLVATARHTASSASAEDSTTLALRQEVLRCLAALLALRNDAKFGAGSSSKKRRGANTNANANAARDVSLVGSRLVELAPALVAAIVAPDNGNSSGSTGARQQQRRAVADAATSVVRSLLPPACPREECPPVLVRDLVLIPLSEESALQSPPCSSTDGIGAVAVLLTECVDAAARLASSAAAASASSSSTRTSRGNAAAAKEEEEMARSLRVESAVLGMMQQMKPVLANLIEATVGEGEAAAACTSSVVQMLRSMHRWAPHAVESQIAGAGASGGGAGDNILAHITCGDSDGGGAGTLSKAADAAACTTSTAAQSDDTANGGDNNSSSSSSLPPFYAHLTEAPIVIGSAKELEATLHTIQDDLVRGDDSELWNLRFDALRTLERIVAGGIVRVTSDDDNGDGDERQQLQLRSTFLATVRKMPIEKQILDLRSQITREACRFLVALAYELRETGEQDCHASMATLADLWMPAVLRLAISGVRLMATQGMNCMLHLAALGGSHGYPRVVPVLCNGCVGKKVHQNHRRGCILALTAALRVWGGYCLERHVDAIGKAVAESACHRDPSVREEGRKAFWALHGREEFRYIAEGLLATMDVREQKRLNGAKAEADGEWENGGRMEVMVRTGVDVASASKASGAKRSTGPATTGRRGAKGSVRPGTGAGAAIKKKKASVAASTRPSIRDRMKAQAMAKAREQQMNGADDGFVVVESAKPAPQATPSMLKRTPGRKSSVSTSTTPFARGKTPRKPAVPKQTPGRRASSSALPPTTPGRAPASIAKSTRKNRVSTPGRMQASTPASMSRQRRTSTSNFTPSSRNAIRNIEDFGEMANSDQWSQREKAFVALSAALEKDMTPKNNNRRSSVGGDRPSVDLTTFISTNTSVEQYVGFLLDNMKEKNIRVCRSATQCCGVGLRHREMKMAIAPYLHLVIPTTLNVIAKYDKGGAATANVSDAATDCLDAISRLVIPEDMVKLFAAALANHNVATSTAEDSAVSVGSVTNPHHILTDYAVQKLVDLLSSAIKNIGGGSSIMSPSDMSAFLKELAKIVARPSNRHTSTPQHMTRAADDKVKASVCALSRILLEEYDAYNTVDVFRMMEQGDTDALIHCIWTFGGQWGADLRERVVSTVKEGGDNTDSINSAIVEGTFGADLLCKSPTEQADLFSDLLSPKAKKRTPENDPLKALAAVATPKTPALPCDIGTRLLGVDATPSTTSTSEDSTSSGDIKSPLLPKKLNVDPIISPQAESGAETIASAYIPEPISPMESETRSGESLKTPPAAKTPSVSINIKTPAVKTPAPAAATAAATYTPYEKALRSLRKGKTPKLEFSPVRMTSTPGGALKFVDRPSAMSPIITEPLRDEDVEALPQILVGLKNSCSPQEQYVVLQSLLKHAKNDGDDPRWKTEFSGIVDCLLGE